MGNIRSDKSCVYSYLQLLEERNIPAVGVITDKQFIFYIPDETEKLVNHPGVAIDLLRKAFPDITEEDLLWEMLKKSVFIVGADLSDFIIEMPVTRKPSKNQIDFIDEILSQISIFKNEKRDERNTFPVSVWRLDGDYSYDVYYDIACLQEKFQSLNSGVEDNSVIITQEKIIGISYEEIQESRRKRSSL